jgi:hypothetical protein
MSELPPRPSLAAVPRFASKARESLFFARYEASHSGSASIEPEHLLLGLMKASEGLRNGLFAQVPHPLETARNEIATRSAAPIPTSVQIPLGERTKGVLQRGAVEADRLHHTEIGVVHLLLGVPRCARNPASGRRAGLQPRRSYCGRANAMYAPGTAGPPRPWRPPPAGGPLGAAPGVVNVAGNVPFACATGSTTNWRPFT